MPVVPAPPVATTGVYASSAISALIASVNFLQNKPAAQIYCVAVQSIPNNSATPLNFDSERFDKDPSGGSGGHDNVTNNTRYTAVYPGWYHVSGRYTYAANATGFREVYISVNGVGVNETLAFGPTPSGALSQQVGTDGDVFLNAGDFVELYVLQTSGGALNTDVANNAYPRMTIEWIRNG